MSIIVVLVCILLCSVCVPILFVHAIGTSNLDANARNGFCRNSGKNACVQCGGKADRSQIYRAAHTIAYIYFPLNCCIGNLTLQHVCSKCNHHTYPNGKRFFRCIPCGLCRIVYLAGPLCQVLCRQRDFSQIHLEV